MLWSEIGWKGAIPYGYACGKPFRITRTVEELGSTAVVQMQPGDVFVIETPGCGGYGAIALSP